MNYITYSQVEELLRKVPLIQAYLKIKQREYSELVIESRTSPQKITRDEILQTLSYGNHVLSDMPHSFPVHPDDKILRIIQETEEIMELEELANDYVPMLKKIQDEIKTVGIVENWIYNALMILPKVQRVILTDFYCKDKEWKSILNKLKIEITTAKRTRRKAIRKMLEAPKITQRQYQLCMEKLESENIE